MYHAHVVARRERNVLSQLRGQLRHVVAHEVEELCARLSSVSPRCPKTPVCTEVHAAPTAVAPPSSSVTASAMPATVRRVGRRFHRVGGTRPLGRRGIGNDGLRDNRVDDAVPDDVFEEVVESVHRLEGPDFHGGQRIHGGDELVDAARR